MTDKVGGSATGSLRGLVNTRNRATSLMLRMVSPFNGSGPNRNGTTQSTIFPANATQDSLYGNTADWQGFANVTPSFKLVGLDPERTYNFTFYASRMGAADIREADYTATGFNSASTPYDAANNVDGTAVLVGIIPDAEWTITISLAPTDRNNNAYRFVYLGAMRMDEIPQQQPVVFVKEPADQTVEELRPVTFAAAVDSTPPYTIQWFKNGQPIRDANEFTYTIDSATLDLDGSVFSVKVSNELYSATSRQAVLHVIPDVNVPRPAVGGGGQRPDSASDLRRASGPHQRRGHRELSRQRRTDRSRRRDAGSRWADRHADSGDARDGRIRCGSLGRARPGRQ